MNNLPPSLRAACVSAASTASSRFRASAGAGCAASVLAGEPALPRPLWQALPWEGLGRRAGEDPKPPRCGRLVMDDFASAGETQRLLHALRGALGDAAYEQHGDASLALDVLLRAPPPSPHDDFGGSPLLDVGAVALVDATVQRMRARVADAFGVAGGELRVAGVLASRLSAPGVATAATAAAAGGGADEEEEEGVEEEGGGLPGGVAGYWNPHVDKANRCLYDFSSILYLTSHGVDFGGGRFVFLDGDGDGDGDGCARDDSSAGEEEPAAANARGGTAAARARASAVAPRVGRFVAFTSGLENVHHVEPVTHGERFTLSAWFTHGAGSADAVPIHAN